MTGTQNKSVKLVTKGKVIFVLLVFLIGLSAWVVVGSMPQSSQAQDQSYGSLPILAEEPAPIIPEDQLPSGLTWGTVLDRMENDPAYADLILGTGTSWEEVNLAAAMDRGQSDLRITVPAGTWVVNTGWANGEYCMFRQQITVARTALAVAGEAKVFTSCANPMKVLPPEQAPPKEEIPEGPGPEVTPPVPEEGPPPPPPPPTELDCDDPGAIDPSLPDIPGTPGSRGPVDVEVTPPDAGAPPANDTEGTPVDQQDTPAPSTPTSKLAPQEDVNQESPSPDPAPPPPPPSEVSS
jgi:hypothetical protein